MRLETKQEWTNKQQAHHKYQGRLHTLLGKDGDE